MEVRALAPGEKITEPGVYDLEISRYHSQCCDGPSISSSGLRKLLLESPAHFWLESDMNPNRVESAEKEAFIIGRAAHHLLLGESDFNKHFIVRPEDAPDGRKWNGNNLSCKEWLAEKALAGITVLTSSQIEKIKGMAGLQPWQKGMVNCGLANTPIVAQGGILNGHIEKSFFWKDEATGIWLKARPDSVPFASNDYADLKTSNGVDHRSLQISLFERGYHIQGALVGMGARAVLGVDMASFNLIFVDKNEPHPVSVRTLRDEDIALGEQQIFAGLKILRKCLDTGVWPGPTARDADAEYLALPGWGRDRMEEQLTRFDQEAA